MSESEIERERRRIKKNASKKGHKTHEKTLLLEKIAEKRLGVGWTVMSRERRGTRLQNLEDDERRIHL